MIASDTSLIHAVIFDIDGTLLESCERDHELYLRAVNSVLGTVHIRPELTDYTQSTDTGILREIFADNEIAATAELVAEVQRAFVSATEEHVSETGPFVEVPGARQFFGQLLQSDQHAVAIATGGWRRTAMLKLHTAGFALDGVPVFSSDDADKRHEIMLLALASLKTDAATITYYGDASWDQMACEKLGWSFRAVGPSLGGISSYAGEAVIT